DGAIADDVVARAVFDVYGARLAAPHQIEAFEKLCAKAGIEKPERAAPSTLVSKKTGFVTTPHIADALARTTAALEAGETVLLQGPGQSGATRLVDEIGARTKQDVVTVVCHNGTDPQALMELPVFDDDGRVYFRAGRVAKALTEGKILYVDHLDHMPVERQN